MRAGHCLQIHSDGGYTCGAGAAAFVVHAVDVHADLIHRVGYSGVFMSNAHSAFHAEITAIDLAISFVRALTERIMRVTIYAGSTTKTMPGEQTSHARSTKRQCGQSAESQSDRKRQCGSVMKIKLERISN